MESRNNRNLRTALIDAGCTEEIIHKVVSCGNAKQQIHILQKHRTSLLNQMHASQKRIDVLDYVVRYLQGKETIL